MKRHDAYVVADLNTYVTIARQWGRPEVVDTFMTMPAVRHLSPEDRIRWRAQGYKNRTGDLSPQVRFLAKFTRALSEAGVHLVAGTHLITVDYFQTTGNVALQVFCRKANFTIAVRSVSSSVLRSSTYALVDFESGSR